MRTIILFLPLQIVDELNLVSPSANQKSPLKSSPFDYAMSPHSFKIEARNVMRFPFKLSNTSFTYGSVSDTHCLQMRLAQLDPRDHETTGEFEFHNWMGSMQENKHIFMLISIIKPQSTSKAADISF